MTYTYGQKYKINNYSVRLRNLIASFIVGAVSFGFIGASSAKEITSGGAPAGGNVAVCSPVKSLSYRGDARVGETGLAAIDINYSVAPCDKNPVRVSVVMFESANGAVFYDNQDAALSGKFTLFGVKVRTSYQVVVTVYDAQSNAVVGTQRIFAAAIPKGV
jgi:hypothetical protein